MAKETKTSISYSKVYLLYFGLTLFALSIACRMGYLMFVEGAGLRTISDEQSYRLVKVDAIRGNIFSSDSTLMATSVSFFTLNWDLGEAVVSRDTFNVHLQALCDSMACMYPSKKSSEYKREYLEARRKKKRNYLIKRNITYTELLRIKTFPIFKKGQHYGGLIVTEKEKRIRPYRDLAERTIGYYNAETKIGVGLEYAFNESLEGVSGMRLTKKVAPDVWRPVYSTDALEPQNGQDIYSTIDIRIQDVAENALRKCLEENEAEHGCAVLMEVSTGEVKAIANLKKNTNGRFSEEYNYAIGESVEPGSTFKLASMIAILEEGLFDVNSIVPTGTMSFVQGLKAMSDSKRDGYGHITLKEAFEKSSNVGIAYAALQTFPKGREQVYVDYYSKMCLDKPMNIELKGEGVPLIKSPSTKNKKFGWSAATLPWSSTGYEVEITPLHQLALYNAVANNGKMMKPFFVKEIKSGDNVVYKNEPVVLKDKICSKKTIAAVQDLLESVVTSGTAKSLSHAPYKIAGKTGTAVTNYGKGELKKYRASFAGYFPANDPKYSCIVVITNPQKGKVYGGELAAPVFKEIADKVFATLLKDFVFEDTLRAGMIDKPCYASGKGKDIKTVYKYLQIPVSGFQGQDMVRMRLEDKKVQTDVLTVDYDLVPDLSGMGVRDAMNLLEKMGFNVRVSGRGVVKKQSIKSGTPIQKGSVIYLELA